MIPNIDAKSKLGSAAETFFDVLVACDETAGPCVIWLFLEMVNMKKAGASS